MVLKLYTDPLSPPARAVVLTAKALGLALEEIFVDLTKCEHVRPEYKNINSQHTIPTLDDDGTIIWDSHAIAAYLVAKFGKDDFLYPKDIVKRAKVDQRLHFDTGVVFPQIRKTCIPLFKHGGKAVITEEQINLIQEAYTFLEQFLKEDVWIAGNTLTIADLCLAASITSTDLMVPIDGSKFPKLKAWVKKIEALPYYREANSAGLQRYKEFLNQG